jgi:phage tail-like protein
VRRDPYKNFKFRIKWDGRYVAGVSKVSPLKRTTEVIEVRQGSDDSDAQKVPGRMLYEPITLERGITRDREFETWANAVAGTAPGGPGLVNFRKDIVIELHTERGQVALAYRVHRCWVSAYQALPELDARGSDVAIESITLQHEGWERDTSIPEPVEIDFNTVVSIDPSLRLEGIARRVETKASWADLVLPAPQLALLQQLADQVRQRQTVYRDWGFAAVSRHVGVTALFRGAPGTGKTMAAEAIARELQLDLYRVNLAGVVSQYIGETEKHLDRIFDVAQDAGAVLLLDEADALFGKRTTVEESHDRYANLEIAYLLERVERHNGVVILTSNLTSNLDERLFSRVRVVDFPLPDAAAREALWRKAFPGETPLARLDYKKLAIPKMTGDTIRRVATDAAFLAAAADSKVTMDHVLEAARTIRAEGLSKRS